MNQPVDLRRLAVRRDEPSPAMRTRPRHWLSRVVLPLVVLLGFAGVLAWAMRDSLLPARPVTVAPVIVSRAEVHQAGAPVFQAAGWVEPRPTPVIVSALAEGVIERLLVVEGQEVQAGEAVAHLIDADARLELADALANLDLLRAERAGDQATLAAAEIANKFPVQLEGALAEADAMLIKLKSELANLPFQTKSAEARLALAKQDQEGKVRAGDGVAGRSLQRAESELNMAAAAIDELKLRPAQLAREIEAIQRKRDAAARQLELKSEETRRLAEAQAQLQAVEARLRQAQVAVDKAQLRLDRMVVRAPTAGRVLNLIGRPGRRVMGQDPKSEQDATTVATLYDPQSLQVRADVRLADLPHVQPGQTCRIETPAVAGPLEGEVLFATSVANEAKNTLEVKVAIKSPPAVIKPQMLVQVTGLALPPLRPESGDMQQPLRILAPRQLIETADGGSTVWLADQAASVAIRRPVKLGTATLHDLVEVVEGLNVGDRLIVSGREGLRDGDRIRVTGEDTTLGVSAGAGHNTMEHSRNP